ncbi:hypothetical protein E24_00001 [Faustovirus]|nr:hypothetical protein PRJ_Fausto_00001 [Faustovirus]AMN82937.1 hypothetical protein E24_00001 [Faustovirus]AMN83924.1 hypothetical protein D5a_00001 [Faustovirus]AMN84909.1 hypothetical protein E23_00001 [Faustovirus]QBR98895.1 hypothetical protein [Faustovirus mariensis]
MSDKEFELWMLENDKNKHKNVSGFIPDDPDYIWWWLNRERLEYIIYDQPYCDIQTLFYDEIVEYEPYDRLIKPRFIKSTKYITDVRYIRNLFPNQFKRAFVTPYILAYKHKQHDTDDYTEYVYQMFDYVEYVINYKKIIDMLINAPHSDEIAKGRIPTHVLDWLLSGNQNYIMDTMNTRVIFGPSEHVINVKIFGDEYYELNSFEKYVYDIVKLYVPHNIVIFNYRPGWLSFKSSKNGLYYAREIDIWFPEWEFGIECNGEYWHNLNHIKERDGVKLQKCNEIGFDIVVVDSETNGIIIDIIINELKQIKNNDHRRNAWLV